MNRVYKIYMALPFVLLLCLVISGVMVTQFYHVFNGGQYIIVPHLLLILLVHIAFYFPMHICMGYAFVVGFLYDSFYTGHVGIYVAAYCIAVFIVRRIRHNVPANIVTILLTTLIAMTLVDVIVYIFYLYVLNGTVMSLQNFLILRLAPTWIFNIVLYLAVYYLCKRLIRWARTS